MTGQADAHSGALAGVRVLDLTRILAGPLCGMMLGDMGADVIKIEPPNGDDTRTWGPPFVEGEATYFLGLNRNKRSLVLNMGVKQGQQILADLARKSDVLLDNFKLGTLAKWGFTDAWFDEHAPRLVRCSITGYGSSGPKAAQPGYDFILQAESGLMSITGPQDGTGAWRDRGNPYHYHGMTHHGEDPDMLKWFTQADIWSMREEGRR